MEETYRALLARGPARRVAVALAYAWLSFGMVSLALFLVAQRASGSPTLGGVTVAAFAIGSGAFAPARGRLIDRRGARLWLPIFAVGYAGGLLAVAACGETRAPGWTLVACSAFAGISAPPLIATLRALWSRIVEHALLRRAYTLTSIVGDVAGVAAPAIGGLLFVVSPALPLVVCALAAAAAALVAGRAVTPPVAAESGSHGLLTPALLVLVAVELALGVALGLVEVAVPTAAARWGDTAWSGFLLGAFALGSVVGGVWFGRRSWTSSPQRRYIVATVVLAVALAAPAVARGPATLAPLLICAGLAYGPATISLFEALDALASSRATEALTWVTTAGAAGAAAGSAVSGWATVRYGLAAPFLTASVVLAATASTAGRARRRAV
jgi:MFS family permease